MDSSPDKIVVNGATSQLDRWLRALEPGYAKVDGRTPAELYDFAVQFGALINFYNLDDEIDGDWVAFFLSDPTVLLASIAATDLSALETYFAETEQGIVESRRYPRKLRRLGDSFGAVLELARKVDLWLRALGRAPDTRTTRLLVRELTAAVETDLGERLRELKSYSRGAAAEDALGRSLGFDDSGFLPIWKLDSGRSDATIYHGPEKKSHRIDQAVPTLSSIFHSFLGAVSSLQSFAKKSLEETLDDANHKPQLALYLAFVGLFKHAQNTINTISSRYVNFYYRDILRERPRGPVPDSVYLTFALADSEGVPSATVPQGTLFPAGEDSEDNEILYAADKSLAVTAAALAKLRTLRLIQGRLIPRDDGTPTVTRRILASEISVGEEEAEVGGEIATGEQLAWPTFGPFAAGKTETEITWAARLGFAVASQYLLLTGGTRKVRIKVRFTDGFMATLWEKLAILSCRTGLSERRILRRLLRRSFRLYLSTATGWFEVEGYDIVLPEDRKADEKPRPWFEIDFELTPSALPVEPVDPESEEGTAQEEEEGSGAAEPTDEAFVNATNPAPDLPTLKAYLRQQFVEFQGDDGTARVHPISLLEDMEVRSLDIFTHVGQLPDLAVENTDGEVDTSSPFLVFGAVPVVGSYLRIRNAELFVKKLDDLRIQIRWFALPSNRNGFESATTCDGDQQCDGYYKYYEIGLDGEVHKHLFNNRKFKGIFTVENPGWWIMGRKGKEKFYNQRRVHLFRTLDNQEAPRPSKDGKLAPETDFDHLRVSTLDQLPPYYNPDDSAIRLDLTAPPYAFGDDLYAKNVLNSVIKDLPDASACQEMCLLGCQPLQTASQTIAECISCLAACQDESCVESCLSACETYLFELLGLCLARCRETCSEVGENVFLLAEALRACMDRPAGSERCSCLRDCRDALGELIQDETGEACRRCLGVCLAILDALLCVLTCAGECDEQSGGGHDDGAQGAAVCIADCLACLADASDGDVRSIRSCLRKAESCLLETFGKTLREPSGLEETLASAVARSGEQLLAGMKSTVPARRLKSVEACREELRNLRSSDPRDAEAAAFLQDLLANLDQLALVLAGAASAHGKAARPSAREIAASLGAAGSGRAFPVAPPTEQIVTCLASCKLVLDQQHYDCLLECMSECMQPGQELKYPNEPYHPQAERLTVDYEAHCEIQVAEDDATSCGRFFHLLPFAGYNRISTPSATAVTLLPCFSYLGNLYLGFSSLLPPQTLTLLFQMVSQGTPDDLPQVVWSYLRSNRWQILSSSEIRADSTDGLRNSGIVALGLPTYDPSGNTALDGDYQWLRASVEDDAGDFPDTLTVTPHALLATWQDDGLGTGEHLATSLPAHTITSSVEDLGDIGTIEQPMPSFGGRPRENRRAFETRLGERLRHKDRAILGWDYERLVLERFPSIWKVQTLPAHDLDNGRVPGHVLVVVVPGPDTVDVLDPTEPKAPDRLLRAIKAYLEARNSLFVTLHVVNPVYVRITVDAEVRFVAGEDTGAAVDRLNTELVEYLSPWYYDADRAAKGGWYVSEAAIAEFIRTRSYVEALLTLKLAYDPKIDKLESDWYFLTSARSHDITVPGTSEPPGDDVCY